jgi:hypothetical protein
MRFFEKICKKTESNAVAVGYLENLLCLKKVVLRAKIVGKIKELENENMW